MEFVNFFIDRLLPFWGKTPSFLFDRFEGGANVQLVCDYCGVNDSGAVGYARFNNIWKPKPPTAVA